MANQLGNVSSSLSDLTKPLRDLLSTKSDWQWGPAQAKAFADVRRELSNPDALLAYYDATRETIVSANASSYGLDAVLLQKQPDSHWRPVEFHSRALTSTEQRYAQTEKEALAATWACERFNDYLVGMSFQIQTDHKPLVTLLGSNDLDILPPRIQRFRMRLMRFHYTIVHVPGKELSTADASSRAPLADITPQGKTLQEDVYLNVNQVIESLRMYAERRSQHIRKKTKSAAKSNSSAKKDGLNELRVYQPHAAELTVQGGLLLKGCQLVIPLSLRGEILDRIHCVE